MFTLARDYAAQARTASGINILLGIWMIGSPWVFNFSGTPAVVNSVLVGAVIAIIAACRLAALRNSAGLSGVNLVLASWTIAAPWIIGYATNAGALRNNVALGAVIAVLAIWSGGATVAGERHRVGGTVLR